MRFLLLFSTLLFIYSCEDVDDFDNESKSTAFLSSKTKYGEFPRNDIAIYYDTVKSIKLKPLILFVPGGGWCQGGYESWVKNELINLFINSGCQFAAINYSLSPMPFQIDNVNRVKHPAHVRDVAKAVRWLYDNADKYSIDKNNIYLLGHSAGAHLVSLVATNEKYIKEVGLNLKNITGVISLDGGAYLNYDTTLLFPNDNDVNLDKYYKELELAYYNAFTYDPKVHFDATPIFHINKNKDIPPFLFVSQGANVPYRYKPNMKMAKKLNENKISATFIPVIGYGHLQILSYIGTKKDNAIISNHVLSFIKHDKK